MEITPHTTNWQKYGFLRAIMKLGSIVLFFSKGPWLQRLRNISLEKHSAFQAVWLWFPVGWVRLYWDMWGKLSTFTHRLRGYVTHAFNKMLKSVNCCACPQDTSLYLNVFSVFSLTPHPNYYWQRKKKRILVVGCVIALLLLWLWLLLLILS